MLRNVWNVSGPESSYMVHAEEWAEQYYHVQQDQFRSETDWGEGFIKRKAKPVSSQPLNGVSEFLSGFQLHRTDHLLSFQANERVGAK